MVILGFIFQSGVEEIENQQFLANCPMPISGGIATAHSIVNNRVNYTIVYDTNSTTYHLSDFQCTLDPLSSDPRGVSVAVFESNNDWFSTTFGQIAYVQMQISRFFETLIAQATTAWLFINAPAEVTGLSFFTVINAVIIGLFGLGIAIILRGSG